MCLLILILLFSPSIQTNLEDLVNEFKTALGNHDILKLEEILDFHFEIDRCGIDKIGKDQFISLVHSRIKTRKFDVLEKTDTMIKVDVGIAISEFRVRNISTGTVITSEKIMDCKEGIKTSSLINDAGTIAKRALHKYLHSLANRNNFQIFSDDFEIIDCDRKVISRHDALTKMKYETEETRYSQDFRIHDERLLNNGDVMFTVDYIDVVKRKNYAISSTSFELNSEQKFKKEDQWLCEREKLFSPFVHSNKTFGEVAKLRGNAYYNAVEVRSRNKLRKLISEDFKLLGCQGEEILIIPENYFLVFNNTPHIMDCTHSSTGKTECNTENGAKYTLTIEKDLRISSEQRCPTPGDVENYQTELMLSMQDLIDEFVEAINKTDQEKFTKLTMDSFNNVVYSYPIDMPKMVVGGILVDNGEIRFGAMAEWTEMKYVVKKVGREFRLAEEVRIVEDWKNEYERKLDSFKNNV